MKSLKKISEQTKEKQTHRYREGGKRIGVGKMDEKDRLRGDG